MPITIVLRPRAPSAEDTLPRCRICGTVDVLCNPLHRRAEEDMVRIVEEPHED